VSESLVFDPPIIAHRGLSSEAPENTLIAFIKAAQLGVKWIEFDVMQATCGEPVIFHDDGLARTTNAKGLLQNYSFAYLQTLDAGSWFNYKFSSERIPSLRQAIDFLDNAKISANVEIKSAINEEELITRVLKEINPYIHKKRSTILFSSFSMSTLYLLRKHAPDCLLGVLLHEWENNWQNICLDLQCASVHVNEEIMTAVKAQEIKSMQKKLLCYTVNDPKRAKELYSWGVDAVFSDYPARIMKSI